MSQTHGYPLSCPIEVQFANEAGHIQGARRSPPGGCDPGLGDPGFDFGFSRIHGRIFDIGGDHTAYLVSVHGLSETLVALASSSRP